MVTAFIVGVAVLFGFNFSFHIAAAWVTLLPGADTDPGAYQVTPVTVAVGAMLVITSAIHLESWPLNCHALFSYNYEQLQRLLDISVGSCSFVLSWKDEHAGEAIADPLLKYDRCLIGVAASADPLPSIYHHELVRLVGGRSFGFEKDPSEDECLERLQHWVCERDSFLHGESLRPFDMVELLPLLLKN
ncbi:unnamed protein product [Prorocentrum cordatum]|uniref:Uncharacterized protein n=1 Tax=Prorocentrum cordatum TaxID=2364126 RepID=A0ABN9RWV2_9DINO|nr:unnamed protein product [Polarella glacialis]